jgi:hypothetical protein
MRPTDQTVSRMRCQNEIIQIVATIMKQYCIRVTLPAEEFLTAAHLLGKDWQSYRCFDTAEERDRQFEQMQELPPYYQRDESPLQVLEKVERESP